MATANSIPELANLALYGPTDLLVMVAAMLPERLDALVNNVSTVFPDQSVLMATENPLPEHSNSSLRMIPAPPGSSGWSLTAPEFVNVAELAEKSSARAILMLGPGSESLAPGGLLQLAGAILGGTTDLAVPYYSLPPNAGMINSAVLYPLTRALFSARVRFPFAVDLGLSPRMAQRLAAVGQKLATVDPAEGLVWPVDEAAVAGFSIDEFEVGHRTLPQPTDSDINTILARVTGSFFADIDLKAAYWQRARRAPTPRRVNVSKALTDGTADVPRMVESFRFAYSNLLEIWSLVLPPHSLLGLKRLSLLSPSDFRMPDSLWARIVFDFLIAYRQRTINRGHLLGAFIPLYLAWVAGHINLGNAGTDSEAHIEAVATAFEVDKPYLVSRWRWPDRFNA
jgi:hypothetical protein